MRQLPQTLPIRHLAALPAVLLTILSTLSVAQESGRPAQAQTQSVAEVAATGAGAAENSASGTEAGQTSEQATLEFLRQYHPETLELLTQLQKKRPGQYRDAVTELTRARERLERTRKRNAERYELELKIWQHNTSIRLLAARLSQSRSSTGHDELVRLIQERNEQRRQLLELEQARLTDRLARIEEQLRQHHDQADQLAESEADRLLSKTRAKTVPVKLPAKQAGKRNSGEHAMERTSGDRAGKEKSGTAKDQAAKEHAASGQIPGVPAKTSSPEKKQP
jgi:hypothetical protein